jgi:hypothetical protein
MKLYAFLLGFYVVCQKMIYHKCGPIHLDPLYTLFHCYDHYSQHLILAPFPQYFSKIIMVNPRFSLKVCNSSFKVSNSDLSLVLFFNNVIGSTPTFWKHIIHIINCLSMDIGGSSHKVPPWKQISSILTHTFISRLWSKCGISNKFNILDFSSPVTQLYGSRRISHVPRML